MKSRFTNTPYLVLFIILITFSVSSAYAITITLGGDPVIVNGILDLMGNRITNVGTPTTSTDAATKNYVDNNNFQFIKTVERIGSQVSSSGFGDFDAIVDCVGSEVATGGGFHEITEEDPVVFSSTPRLTGGLPTGWEIGFFSSDGATVTIQATVICATLQNISPFP